MKKAGRQLVWLHGEVKTPPFSREARQTAGRLLRDVQEGARLSMPDSRPMPSIGSRCHELRIDDNESQVGWRIVYRIDPDALVIVAVFKKKTQQTPQQVIDTCKRRLKMYDSI